MSLQASSITRAFEEQRRQRIMQLLVPLALSLTSIAILGGIYTFVTHTDQPGMRITVGLSIVFVICTSISGWLLQRHQVSLSTTVFVTSAVITIVGLVTVLCVVTPLSSQSLIQLACLSIVVVLAGAVGNVALILGAAILESFVIIAIISLSPASGILLNATLGLRTVLIIGVLTYHWAIAALTIAVLRSQGAALQRLEETFDELEQARQVDALKDQFITQVNHELRTPVMSLQGYVDLLYELDESLSAPERRAMLLKARSAGETLTRFVNDVLDTRRITRDEDFNPVFTPVRPAVNDALTLIDPHETRIDGRDIRVTVPASLAVWGDAIRLRQILANLVSNALKYSDRGTPIEISARNDDGYVLIMVRDYGLGIPPDQVKLLFNRFVRLPRDLKSPIRGTGVGLYLCRIYAEAMGGSIDVMSSGVPGEGSCFLLRLPVPPTNAVNTSMTPTLKIAR